MNQILLQVLSQDPLKTPGVCLSFRWLLPLIPHLETLCKLFMLPLLGTWLGCLFLDMYDLWDQVFSFTGFVYLATFVGMIPKPNTSSKLWIDTNLFTIVCYTLYFAELALLAYLRLNLEYSIGWIASITFATSLTFLFYGILLKLGLSSNPYFKTIVRVYLLADLGNLLALGFLLPFDSCRIFLLISGFFLIYLLLPYRHPLLFANIKSPIQYTQSLTILRCILWGALSVWADYIVLTPFYVLEMILASDGHHKDDSMMSYVRQTWNTQKTSFFLKNRKWGNPLLIVLEFFRAFASRKKKIFIKEILIPVQSKISLMKPRPVLYFRKL